MPRIRSYKTLPVLLFADVPVNGGYLAEWESGALVLWVSKGKSHRRGKSEAKKSETSSREDFQQWYFALFPTMSWEAVKISEAICLIEHPLLVLISLVSFLIGPSWKFWEGSCVHSLLTWKDGPDSSSSHPGYCRCSPTNLIWDSIGGVARPSQTKLGGLELSFVFHLNDLRYIKALFCPFLFKAAEVFCWNPVMIACSG